MLGWRLLQSLDAALAFGIPGLLGHVIGDGVVDWVSLMMRSLDSKLSAPAPWVSKVGRQHHPIMKYRGAAVSEAKVGQIR